MVDSNDAENGINGRRRSSAPTRRRVLRTLGVGGAIALAGCASNDDDGGDDGSGDGSGDDGSGDDSGDMDGSEDDGGDGGDDSGDDGDTTTPQSLEVVLGNIMPLSGPAGAYGSEIRNATRLAARQAVEAGEVDSVEHLDGDGEYDPGTSRQRAMEQLNNGADVLHGAISDASTIAISELAEQEDVPHIGRSGNITFDLRECRPNTFSYSPSILGWTENGPGYCIRNDLGESVYTIAYDYSYPQDHVQYLTEGLLPATDGENAGVSLLQQGSTDFSGPLTEAQNQDADILNLNLTGTGFLTALGQAEEFGFLDEGVVITNGIGNKAMGPGIDPSIRTYDNFYLGLEWHHTIGEEAMEFASVFQDEYGKIPGVSAVDYVGTRTLLAAIGEAGSLETGDVIEALEGRDLKPQIWGEGEIWRGCDHRFQIPSVTAQGLPESADDFFEVVNVNSDFDQLSFPCDQTVCRSDQRPDWFEE